MTEHCTRSKDDISLKVCKRPGGGEEEGVRIGPKKVSRIIWMAPNILNMPFTKDYWTKIKGYFYHSVNVITLSGFAHEKVWQKTNTKHIQRELHRRRRCKSASKLPQLSFLQHWDCLLWWCWRCWWAPIRLQIKVLKCSVSGIMSAIKSFWNLIIYGILNSFWSVSATSAIKSK